MEVLATQTELREKIGLTQIGTKMEGMQDVWEDVAQRQKTLHRGDVIEGIVAKVDHDAILVDIGAKTEGIVYANEMKSLGYDGVSQLKTGEQVLVCVVQPENQEGQAILSLDRARSERGWFDLQHYFETGEVFEAEVVDFNKGGLIVNIEGIHGFVPSSQLASLRPEQGQDGESDSRLSQMLGKKLHLKVIEINRYRNRLILSERLALEDWRMHQKEKLMEELQEGQIRHGRVTSIRPFGAFIDLGGADGLVHLSELSWGHVENPEEVLKVGDEVDVYVMKVDPETKRIALSLRRAQPEVWEKIMDEYQVGQLVKGTITKLSTFGAFARIEGLAEGLIHISELADRRINHPKEVVKEGDEVTLMVVKFEPERRRLGLSLRQAQEQVAREGEQ